MKKKIIWLCLIAIALLSCKKDPAIKPSVTTASATVYFENYVDDNILIINSGSYISPSNDTFSVQNFKYYISNVKLINSSTGESYEEKDSYHLINQKDKLSFNMEVVGLNDYDQLEFSIGVDQAHNHSIDQPGDLDPNNDMAWGWDIGYKFLLLEGTYKGQSSAGSIVFHIGSDVNYKTIRLNYPSGIKTKAGKKTGIYLEADVNALFKSPHPIDLDVVHEAMGGDDAAKVAVNYAQHMFAIKKIINP